VALEVELVSAEARVWSGTATQVVARTTEGEIGILGDHAPILAVLAPGQVRIESEAGESVVADVRGGFLSVEHNRVTVVSDTAALVNGSGR
jgi:F-type H+-transporting ATPase subunit epsilon